MLNREKIRCVSVFIFYIKVSLFVEENVLWKIGIFFVVIYYIISKL